MDVDEKETAAAEREEENRRLLERWRFDSDDGPAAGPEGAEEQDRELVDDYDAKHVLSFPRWPFLTFFSGICGTR